MSRKVLVVFSVILFFNVRPFVCNAQLSKNEVRDLLGKIDESLDKINTVVYKINYDNKYLSRRDTVKTTAVCSLYRAPKAKMKAYSIVDLEFKELKWHTYGHRRYDGKRVFWANYQVDSLSKDIKPEIVSDKRLVKDIVDNYSKVLLREFMFQKIPFRGYLYTAESIKVTEEIFKDAPVYVIDIKFKDRDGTSDSVEKYSVRKSDLMPVAFYSYLVWENMKQYNYYEVEYLAINTDIPLDSFNVAENETINAKERFNTLQGIINKKQSF